MVYGIRDVSNNAVPWLLSDRPSVPQLATSFLQVPGVFSSKSVAPMADRLIGRFDATLSKHLFDVAKTQAKWVANEMISGRHLKP